MLSSVVLLAILLFILMTAFLNSYVFVRRYIDDTAYHIPMAVEIARHLNPYYADLHSAFTPFWFPAGAEAITALVLLVTRDINYTNLSGSLFFILFLFVTYKFAGIWTNEFGSRLLCVVAASLTPILLSQTLAFYVDIHFNFFIYLSLFMYCLSLAKDDANYSFLGMAAAILSAGIKYHGIAVCAVLLPVGAYCAVKTNRKNLDWWVMIILGLSSIVVSGWYIRNWLIKGNPIYPLSVPEPFQTMLGIIETRYKVMTWVQMSPEATWPHPLVPSRILNFDMFRPDATDDAFGLVFPVSVIMLIVVGTQIARFSKVQRQVLVLLLTTTAAIIFVLPSRFSVPRYILFVPAVAALWPSMVTAYSTNKNLTYWIIFPVILVLGVTYIGGSGMDMFQDSIRVLRENRRPDIMYFNVVEEGNLKIGYLNGRYGFIASLYDRKITNQLVQLHYRDYLLDRGPQFKDPDEFVRYIRSLELDYIWIFDEKAPGADIIRANFPEITFVEDVYK
jgi:hypothetical protein